MSGDGLPPMPTPAEFHAQVRPSQQQQQHHNARPKQSSSRPVQQQKMQQQPPPSHSYSYQQQYQQPQQPQQQPQQPRYAQHQPVPPPLHQQPPIPQQPQQRQYNAYQSAPQTYQEPQLWKSQQYYQSPPPQQMAQQSPPHLTQPRQGSQGSINQPYQRPSSVKPFLPPPSATPAPAESVRQIFRSVDVNNNGRLSERELRSALLNFDRSKFDPTTVKLMFQMFDSDQSGTITIDEFERLWDYLSKWQERFKEFDLDKTFTISLTEFDLALKAFGYRLTPDFTKFVFNSYVKRSNDMTFDLFVQSCVTLLHLSANFNKYGPDSRGTIQLNFEQFMTEVINLR
ncbi:hypothetical protein BZA70DRAFT_277673 [Myxozyma melibiosi]|uniref:EF-hand domain-containing protein n=1 Tax=Myxozyma melibiosi TaxID=54550 RepID=A0ABR1F840_9ASCO